MSFDVQEELRRVFDRAALRKEARSIESPRQWAQAAALMLRCETARTKEKDLYSDRYDARVEVALGRLVDEAASVTRELKPRWAWSDPFDSAGLLRQAQRDVRRDHEQRIATIEDYESRELRFLMADCMRQNNLRGKPREDFGRAADRRSDIERRVIRFGDYTHPKRRR